MVSCVWVPQADFSALPADAPLRTTAAEAGEVPALGPAREDAALAVSKKVRLGSVLVQVVLSTGCMTLCRLAHLAPSGQAQIIHGALMPEAHTLASANLHGTLSMAHPVRSRHFDGRLTLLQLALNSMRNLRCSRFLQGP